VSNENGVIVRCSTCNAWIASTNNEFIEGHISTCRGVEYNGIEGNMEYSSDRVIVLRRRPVIDHRQTIMCIAEIDDVRTKVVVSHIRGGRFIILSTALYEYRHMVGRVIDASDICAVIK
jgi:hypothetical protein